MRKIVLVTMLFAMTVLPLQADTKVNNNLIITDEPQQDNGADGQDTSKKVNKNSFSTIIMEGMDTTDVTVPNEVIDPLNKVSAIAVKMFLKTIVGVLAFFTVMDMAALAITPLRPLLGAEDGGAQGGMGGGGKTRMKLVTSDFSNAVAASEGGAGGEGNQNVWVTYGKMRGTTIVFGLVISVVLLSPQLFRLVVVLVDFVLNIMDNMLRSVR